MDLPHGFGGHTTVWLEICTDLVRDLLQGSGEQNGENLHALCLCLSVRHSAEKVAKQRAPQTW